MKLRKFQILRLILGILFILIFVILAVISSNLSKLLLSQQAAERWQNETASEQISVFFKADSGFSTADLQSLHESIEEALLAQSLTPENKYSRLWYDAYSTSAGKITVTGKRETPADAEVTVIGGDFFLIHPFKLVSGVYFSEQDVMHDRVIIDTRLAWQLFGSSDASGMTVTMQGEEYLIAGVVQPEEDNASETAYGTIPRMYIPYQLYQKISGEETGKIQCYETVLPNPVKGYARTMLTKALNPDDYGAILLRNTGRWKLSGRWDTLKNLKKLLICETVTYPYWENAARIISYDTAILLLFEIISLIYPVIYLIYLICKAYILLDKHIAEKRYAWKNRYRSPMHTDS